MIKPGGHALVFAGTRTQDLMTISLRLGGFEVRDVIEWLYFTGFPKSMDIGKAFDKRAGAKREVLRVGPTVKRMIPGADQVKTGSWIKDNGRTFTPTITVPATNLARKWNGWGTALKPAHEPIIVVRKPLAGTTADTIEKYGTGAINIDGCRIGRTAEDRTEYGISGDEPSSVTSGIYGKFRDRMAYIPHESGLFPANCITLDEEAFYSPYFCVTPRNVSKKAGKADRGAGNTHPTVKPTDLMAWLVRLVTPPEGVVLDPFAGSGSTLVAAKREGVKFVGVEMEQPYEIAIERLKNVSETIPNDFKGKGETNMIRQLTHEECMSLLDSIRSSPPGDWTHDLHTIESGPARFVDRVLVPSGHETVYFRDESGAGAMQGANWDRFAVPRAHQQSPQRTEYEQLTLW
ncbi:site-specific DNA-methyltransferase [Paenibacillus macerans]|nr:site-specific DNA-methyltransferase [Paenibacillus macerans]